MGVHSNNPPARKARKKKSNTGDWGGFVTCEMGSQERKDFKARLLIKGKEIPDLLLILVDEGLNFSISWSDKDNAYLAKVTQLNDDDQKRYMLTAFHSDLETAIRLLLYKHVELMQSDWFDRPSDDDDGDNWG